MVEGWQKVENTREQWLERHFQFEDFKEAWAFMTAVAELAENEKHHPNWSNTYNRLVIRLNTHDNGNAVTAKDTRLALKINQLLAQD